MTTDAKEAQVLRVVEAATDIGIAEHVATLGKVTYVETNGEHTHIRFVRDAATPRAQVFVMDVRRVENGHDYSIRAYQDEEDALGWEYHGGNPDAIYP